jgi:hypothetical protein
MAELENIKKLLKKYLQTNSISDILEVLSELTENKIITPDFSDNDELCEYLSAKLFAEVSDSDCEVHSHKKIIIHILC